ncbi:lysis system i-spanin subunit Rz [Undibacterium rugosum]|uniref:lysis system i-spanin subunit Rz n=1 Tax=Undibacterium rugosum TaxID=2762291 RepID=UPI001B821B35|nr:lysis system i-spanin subunit Rz [Undibacterium rugosum]MBR7777366.1 lysis protein [Undibacterium rugosum]
MTKIFDCIRLLDPRPWIAVVILLIAIVGINKYKNAVHENDKAAAQAQKERADATENTLESERLINRSLATLADQHHKEMQDEKEKRDRFIAGVRAGTIRLSIPVHSCRATAPTTDPAAAVRDSTETRAELTPEAGSTLAAIAGDGDDAIRQLNKCIDAYQAVRTTYNVQTK